MKNKHNIMITVKLTKKMFRLRIILLSNIFLYRKKLFGLRYSNIIITLVELNLQNQLCTPYKLIRSVQTISGDGISPRNIYQDIQIFMDQHRRIHRTYRQLLPLRFDLLIVNYLSSNGMTLHAVVGSGSYTRR